MNRGKSVNSNARLNGSSSSSIFGNKDMRSGFANMVGGVFGSGFAGPESSFQTSGVNHQLLQMIDRCEDMDIIQNRDLLKRLCQLKNRDILKETLTEYSRRGNFIRIYPAKGTDCYDIYFA